jgi:hypothetical protein
MLNLCKQKHRTAIKNKGGFNSEVQSPLIGYEEG